MLVHCFHLHIEDIVQKPHRHPLHQRHIRLSHARAPRTARGTAKMGTQASPCFKLGLTGSIGMGKSTVSNFFQEEGVPVFDADKVVHELYAPGGAAVAAVAALHPTAVVDGGVDRKLLGPLVVGSEEAMKQLEAIVHPLVAAARSSFLQEAVSRGVALVVFDIPLLFETKAEDQVDAIAVVSAPAELQRQRVLARPGMTQVKLDALLKRQVPDEEKRRKATYIIDTGCTLQETRQQVVQLVNKLTAKGTR